MQVTIPGQWPPSARAARISSALLVAGLLTGLFAGLGGCVYRMPIQQGNHLDEATVTQVKPGMTRTQVRYLLGTPMVPGAFDNDRWDYDYYLKVRRLQTPRRAHTTVYFHDDVVDRVVSDVRGNPTEPVSRRPITSPGA